MATTHKSLVVVYLDSDGVVQFGFRNSIPEAVKGTQLLLQNIIIRLFTTSGSNGFEGEDLGGNLYSIIGAGYAPGDESLLRNSFSMGFEAIEQQIKEEQQGQTILDSERLESLTLRSVEYNTKTFTWTITAKVYTAAGTSSLFTIRE